MALNRAVALAVVISILGSAMPANAGIPANPASLRELLETRRGAKTDVIIELRSGSHLLGAVGRMKKSTFYVLDGTSPAGRAVQYSDVRALIDPVTEQRLELLQVGTPTGPVVGRRPPVAFWIILGVAVTVLVIWARVATSGNF